MVDHMKSWTPVQELEFFQEEYTWDLPLSDCDLQLLKIRAGNLFHLIDKEINMLLALSPHISIDHTISKLCGFKSVGEMCRYYDELREKYDEHQMDLKIMHGLIEHREGLQLYESGLVGKIEWARRQMLKKLKKILI